MSAPAMPSSLQDLRTRVQERIATLRGNGNGNGSPLADFRARIQARIDEFRGTDNGTTPQRGIGGMLGQGKLMGQFPRVAKFKRTLSSRGLGKRVMNQKSRPPGMRQQNISPTSQVPAIAEDVYSEKLRAESSPGLSVSL